MEEGKRRDLLQLTTDSSRARCQRALPCPYEPPLETPSFHSSEGETPSFVLYSEGGIGTIMQPRVLALSHRR